MATELERLNTDIAVLREREAATREVLHVISESRTDSKPVFDAILKHATQLCNAPIAGLFMADYEKGKYDLVASLGAKPQFEHAFKENPPDLDPDKFAAARAMVEKRAVHVEDLASPTLYGADAAHRIVCTQTEGIRTTLLVPLIWNDLSIGAIAVWRRQVRPFLDDEIALVETFASQAVIAIENVRHFREVQTRLEREAATREILQVISRNRDDEQPVFEKILQKAAQLCSVKDAVLMLLTANGRSFRAHAGLSVDRKDRIPDREWPLDAPLPIAQSFREGQTVHVRDMRSSAPYRDRHPTYLEMVDERGLRTRLCVPLVQDGKAFGVIALSRYELVPFDAGEIELIETFAAQAVIAIENVRQFREVQTRLEREEATKNILQVISQSRDDELPVFETLLDNALRLSASSMSTLFLVDSGDETLYEAAARGHVPEEIQRFTRENPPRLDDKSSSFVQAFEQRKPVQILDAASTPRARGGPSQRQMAVEKMGIRTILQVPLMQQDQPIGILSIYRTEVRAYNEGEIALLETFAAQAVIAIENVRQFKALEKLNAELGDRVEEQVGEIERMGKLKRFLPTAVADTVISSGSENMLKSHRALLGALFCDIRGFTAFCETAEPEETIEVLQTYHEEMGKLINAHGAGVDHRMGDGIMVLFNDPIPCVDPAGDVVRLAIAMRARMAELGTDWKRMGFRLGFGVGVSLGYATVGMVGYEGRSDYTASGTAINIAARLCETAEDGEILLSTRAAIAVEDDFASVSTGEVTLKGIREPVEIFKLIEASET